MNITFNELGHLIQHIKDVKPNILIVEGYNGVGKSRVLNEIQNTMGVQAYRPNYSGWCRRINQKDRWAICLSFLDVLSESYTFLDESMYLFDRGFVSGVVYNDDMSLALDIKEATFNLKRNTKAKILHILVTCDRESYHAFLDVRGSSKELDYDDCLVFTERYKNALSVAELDYVVFNNQYSAEIGDEYRNACGGCSHYNIADSKCKNPRSIYFGKEVDTDQTRCAFSIRLEVQDEQMLQLSSK